MNVPESLKRRYESEDIPLLKQRFNNTLEQKGEIDRELAQWLIGLYWQRFRYTTNIQDRLHRAAFAIRYLVPLHLGENELPSYPLILTKLDQPSIQRAFLYGEVADCDVIMRLVSGETGVGYKVEIPAEQEAEFKSVKVPTNPTAFQKRFLTLKPAFIDAAINEFRSESERIAENVRAFTQRRQPQPEVDQDNLMQQAYDRELARRRAVLQPLSRITVAMSVPFIVLIVGYLLPAFRFEAVYYFSTFLLGVIGFAVLIFYLRDSIRWRDFQSTYLAMAKGEAQPQQLTATTAATQNDAESA